MPKDKIIITWKPETVLKYWTCSCRSCTEIRLCTEVYSRVTYCSYLLFLGCAVSPVNKWLQVSVISSGGEWSSYCTCFHCTQHSVIIVLNQESAFIFSQFIWKYRENTHKTLSMPSPSLLNKWAAPIHLKAKIIYSHWDFDKKSNLKIFRHTHRNKIHRASHILSQELYLYTQISHSN